MSLNKDRKSRLRPVTVNNVYEEPQILAIFEKVLDKASVRFDQHLEKVTSAFKENLTELALMQKRYIKRLERSQR